MSSDRSLRKLRRSIERLVNANEAAFDAYVSDDYVEGGITGSTLVNFRAAGLPVIRDADEGEADEWSTAIDVSAELAGEGDAHWHALQLSPYDLEAFGDRVEAPDAGGILHEVDVACPCRIEVTASFLSEGAMWTDVEIVRITLDAGEAAVRRRRHEREAFDRLVELGLVRDPDED